MENINTIRRFLYEEAGVVWCLIGIFLSVIGFLRVRFTMKWGFAVSMSIITIVLVGNYIDLKYIHLVEPPKGSSGEANEEPYVPEQTQDPYTLEPIDEEKTEKGGTKTEKENETKTEKEDETKTEKEDETKTEKENETKTEKEDETKTEKENETKTEKEGETKTEKDAETRHSELMIEINSWEFSNNGFYYKYPDPENPDMNIIIDYNPGIFGTFQYSRELTEEELSNWFHGGNLYDIDGNKIGVEGNYPSFWSDPNGMFAVEFPDEMKPGVYTYELYQFIDNQYVSDTISITVE